MIESIRCYRQGRPSELVGHLDELTDLADLTDQPGASEPGRLVWVHLVDPTDDELASVAGRLGLPPPPVARSHAIRPWIRRSDRSTFVAVRYPPDPEDPSTGRIASIDAIVADGVVVTSASADAPGLDDLAEDLEGQSVLVAHGAGAVVLELFSWSIRRFRSRFDGIDDRMGTIETALFSDDRSDPTREIYDLAREVVELRRAANTLEYPLDQLSRDELPGFDEQLRTWFVDVGHGVERLVGQLDAYSDALLNALQAYLSKVAMRQNDDMRKISAWVAIAAVPTAIAGIYGMNFGRNMPLLDSDWGFPVVMALMVAACAYLSVRFRRAGWL